MARLPETPTVGALRRVGGWSLLLPRSLATVLALGWMGFIWFLSSSRGRHAIEAFDLDVLWNNFLHAPAFGLLAYLLLLGLPRREDGWARIDLLGALFVLGSCALYAAVDELHQGQVPRRVASVTDWITDVVGASSVVWIASYLGRPGQSSEWGLWWRFLLGLAACFAAALAATLA